MSVNNIGNKFIIGIDLGDAKNGLALGHLATKTAVGLKTVATELLKQELTRLIAEYDVECLVVGMPYNLAGNKTIRTQKTIELVEELKKWFNIKIVTVDERWTTKQAKRSSTSDNDDRGAAILIAQTYLDGLN